MSMNSAPSVDEGWSPEPELLEPTPRHFEPVFEYPDHNKPNVVLFCALGAAFATAAFVLIGMGIAQHHRHFLAEGIPLAILGAGLLIYFPRKASKHEERVRNLVENGRPMMANLLTSENLTGDSTFGRVVKYQVAMPGGELAHRVVNADERRLPKRIPGKATVLVDVRAMDVELYCVLPYRAIATGRAEATAGTQAPIPVMVTPPPGALPNDALAGLSLPTVQAPPGQMGTLSIGGESPAPRRRPAYEPTQILDANDIPSARPIPAPKAPAPAAPEAPPEPQPATPAADERLPWE